MSKLMELFDRRNKTVAAARAFLDSKTANGATLSAEDSSVYDKMESEIMNLGKEIEREGKLSHLENDLKNPTSMAITGHPTASETPSKNVRESEDYKRDFGNILRGKPTVSNVMQTGIDADGGFLVPIEFEKQIIDGLEESNIIRSIAKTIKTSAERKIPVAASHSVAKWTAENAAYSESNPTFEQKTIDAYKLTDLVKVSMELLQDSMFNLESYIAGEFARAFGIAEEESFCVGTGVGQPTGIFTENSDPSRAGGSVGVTAGGSNITVDNLIDLVYALKSPYRRNAVFLMRDITVSGIRKLKDSNGMYLWQPSIQAGQPDRLLGYPLYTSPYVPQVESGALPVAFGDFSNYWIADRMGRTVQRLNELYAGSGQIGYIATERVDGKVILAEGIKLLKMGA